MAGIAGMSAGKPQDPASIAEAALEMFQTWQEAQG